MKLKKYVKDCVVIAEDNTLWQFTGMKGSREVELGLKHFCIENNILYFIGTNNYNTESFYNPIRQLSSDEIINYLEYII